MHEPRELKVFEEFIHAHGLRMTSERLALFDEIFAQHGHIDAGALWTALRRRRCRISRATVYRNLDLLVDCGLARKQRLGRAARSLRARPRRPAARPPGLHRLRPGGRVREPGHRRPPGGDLPRPRLRAHPPHAADQRAVQMACGRGRRGHAGGAPGRRAAGRGACLKPWS